MRFLCFLLLALGLSYLSAMPAKADAGDYPSRPIKFIIPSSLGGGTDISFRVLAGALEPLLGQKIEIVDKPADSGVEGLTELANALPDGYTLGAVWNGPLTASPHLRQLPYSLSSFTPIVSTFESDYLICAYRDFPAATGPEFVTMLRQEPFHYSYGNEGKGGSGYFAAERLFNALGVLVRSESFNGSSEAARYFIAGNVDFYVGTAPPIRPYIKSGEAKCPIVMGKHKPDFLAGASTVAEIGAPGSEAALWRMIVAPKGLPAEKIAKLEGAVREAMTAPSMRAFFAEQGERPLGQGAAQTAARLSAEYAAFAGIAEKLGLKSD